MLFGGLGLHLLAGAAAIRRAFGARATERLVAAGALACVVSFTSDVDGIILLGAVDVVLLVTLLVERTRMKELSARDEV